LEHNENVACRQVHGCEVKRAGLIDKPETMHLLYHAVKSISEGAGLAHVVQLMVSPALADGVEDVEERDEEQALKEPEAAELKGLKSMFEGMVGAIFLAYADGRKYMLLRHMFVILQVGISSNELHRACEVILDEWAEMKMKKAASEKARGD
jgi:hypothetical protein